MKKKKPLTRSQNMARIKSKNTKLEVYIRKLLFKMGYRYRINYSLLPGTPDIYILKYKTAIFVTHSESERAFFGGRKVELLLTGNT